MVYNLFPVYYSGSREITFNVVIDKDSTMEPGYHVENLLLQIQYKKNGKRFQSELKPVYMATYDNGIFLTNIHQQTAV